MLMERSLSKEPSRLKSGFFVRGVHESGYAFAWNSPFPANLPCRDLLGLQKASQKILIHSKQIPCFVNELGIKEREARLDYVRDCLHNPGISSTKDLDKPQAMRLIDSLESTLAMARREGA